jgi:DNA-binding transcriptional ArsR family regulator
VFVQVSGEEDAFPGGKPSYDDRVPHPLFDELLHERTRLQLAGLLAAVVEAEFATLQRSLGTSASALSKHVKALEGASYVTTRRQREGSRIFTLVAMTDDGRHAFCGHVAEIQRLAGVASMRGKGAAGAARVPRKYLTMTRRPAG